MTVSPRKTILIVACGAAVLLISIGTRSSFGLYLAPISADLGRGRETFAFAIALQNLVWGLAQPFVGAVADRYGPGKVLAASACVLSLGLYLMANSAGPTQITLSTGVVVGIGLSGTGFPIILAVIGHNVTPSRRSIFMGLASAGASAGQLLLVPMAQVFITRYGWGGSLAMFAAIALIIVPLAAALAGRPASVSKESVKGHSLRDAVREARHHKGYWYLTAGFFVCGFHVAFIGTHLPAYIMDKGLAASVGAAAIALIGLGNLFGSVIWGAMGGRYRKKYVLSLLYCLRAILMVAFLLVPATEASIGLFAGAMGFLWLGTVPVTSSLVAEIFGARYVATLFGFVFLSHQVGSFFGAWLGGYAYDVTGGYDVVWWLAAALALAATLLHAPIDDRPIVRLAGQEA